MITQKLIRNKLMTICTKKLWYQFRLENSIHYIQYKEGQIKLNSLEWCINFQEKIVIVAYAVIVSLSQLSLPPHLD